ncbi:hypothetical protein [Clostridium botulinum]|nr:hypothetical protein [Clostridium botulinum]
MSKFIKNNAPEIIIQEQSDCIITKVGNTEVIQSCESIIIKL